MINLIPPAAQSQVKREYWIRVATVWAYLVGTAFIIITILYVPTYALVHNQLSIFSDGYQTATEDNVIFQESEAAVKQANAIAALLAEDQSEVPFATLVAEMKQIASAEIAIGTIIIARDEVNPDRISVSGESATRSALAAFRDALEASAYFATAELPLSNLAKDREISFTISVTPAPVNTSDI